MLVNYSHSFEDCHLRNASFFQPTHELAHHIPVEVLDPGTMHQHDMSMKELVDAGLNAARTGGAQYADVRISRHKDQGVSTREDHVQGVSNSESFGFSVRVLVDGTWGFAASHQVTQEQIVAAAKRALAIARANRTALKRPVELTAAGPYVDMWQTPVAKDPFDVPIDEKVELLLAINAEALKVSGIKYCSAAMMFQNERKYYASTDGSYIDQNIFRTMPYFSATAIDSESGKFETRAGVEFPARGLGYEYIEECDLVNHATRIAEDAVKKLEARSVEPGKRDIILHPSNMWLTIHESIGHSTELDRALGLEADCAGTSFLTIDKLGTLKIGSDLVNFKADRTIPGGLATCGYDDDGVKTTEWQLVKDGLFVDYQTIRDQPNWPEYRNAREASGLPEVRASYGCSYADNWGSFPFQRQPNIHLVPGKKRLSLDELIADTEDGIYIVGDSSFSIDQQRRNFQFSGQVFYEIKNGKITGMLNDVAYQAITPEFWGSCDAICDETEWHLNGTINCGKGQPMQCGKMSHGASPARFRQVNILNTRRTV